MTQRRMNTVGKYTSGDIDGNDKKRNGDGAIGKVGEYRPWCLPTSPVLIKYSTVIKYVSAIGKEVGDIGKKRQKYEHPQKKEEFFRS